MDAALTPSVEVVSESQARKLVSQLSPGLETAIVGSRFPGDLFQQLIMNERELRLRSRFIAFLRDVAKEIINWTPMHLAYFPGALETAVKVNNFGNQYLSGFRLQDVPLKKSGSVRYQVGEFPLDRTKTIRQITDRMADARYELADPLVTLNYALCLPDDKFHVTTYFRNNSPGIWEWSLFTNSCGRCLSITHTDMAAMCNGTSLLVTRSNPERQ